VIAARFPKAAVALVLALTMLVGVPRPAQAFLDKTRFVAHLGVAYFVFHHWVLRPYEQHAFDPGAPHRTSSIIKAGVALLFAVHEVKVAERIAALSPDPLLHKLNAEVIALGAAFATIGTRFKGGQFSPTDVQSLTTSTSTLSTDAAAGGAPIKDVPVAVPGG
jgi:hypothetical protein